MTAVIRLNYFLNKLNHIFSHLSIKLYSKLLLLLCYNNTGKHKITTFVTLLVISGLQLTVSLLVLLLVSLYKDVQYYTRYIVVACCCCLPTIAAGCGGLGLV